MIYRLLADLVVLVHLAFVVWVVLGGLLALRWRWVVWLHLPAAIWGALIEFGGWICPLTPLENWLRCQGGEEGYVGGFIQHYLVPVIYPTGLTREIQIALGVGVVLFNLVVYTLIVRQARKPL
ncbi:MAG: DUF2784 domain-containing protein [Thermoanaerobaculia bacterium]